MVHTGVVIKAVIFDFFGVIISDEYWQLIQQDRQADSVFQDYSDDVNAGRIGWAEFVRKVADATGASIDEVNAMYASEQINPLVVGLLNKLRGDYKTGLITNAHHEHLVPLLEQHLLSDLFDTIVVSSELGIVKPNPAIFEHALDDLGIAPQEAIYIDDLERHVLAARALGMQAIQYHDFASLKRELDALLADTDN